jgi:hypothetical protein
MYFGLVTTFALPSYGSEIRTNPNELARTFFCIFGLLP